MRSRGRYFAMHEVVRSDERLGKISWREPREVTEPSVRAGDCVVVCGGFEERLVEAIRRICESGAAGFQVALVKYRPTYQQNRTDEIRTIARDVGIKVAEVVYDRMSPAGIGDTVANLARESERIIVDISGMSRLLIVQVIVALLTHIRQPIVVIYSEAESYFPTETEVEQGRPVDSRRWPLGYISSGVFEIATDTALSSVSMLGSEIRLVAFPSFDPAQLGNLIQELQPTYTDLIDGLPPVEENGWRTDAIRRLNAPVVATVQNCLRHSASTLDYRETLNILLDLYRRRSMFDRIVIAPTGSKMQALALGLFRSVMYDVQIVYPTPQMFTHPNRHTMGVRRLYTIELPVAEMAV